ncbi:hypothetical protein S83_003012 [Arachis hypogaea]
MKVSDSAGNDPKQPCLTSELQPPRNMNEANRKNDDHDTTALNLDLTMDVPLLNVVEEFIPPSTYKSPPPPPHKLRSRLVVDPKPLLPEKKRFYFDLN